MITSPFTFVATLNAILYAGATPRFVDIGDDFNLDPALDRRRAHRSATRALMPVHLYGLPADMPRLLGQRARADDDPSSRTRRRRSVRRSDRAPRAHSVPDASPSTRRRTSRPAKEGSSRPTTTPSPTPRGVLRDQGQRGTYEYVRPGFNFRMTELQAALGVAQMQRLRGDQRRPSRSCRSADPRARRSRRSRTSGRSFRSYACLPSVHDPSHTRRQRRTRRTAARTSTGSGSRQACTTRDPCSSTSASAPTLAWAVPRRRRRPGSPTRCSRCPCIPAWTWATSIASWKECGDARPEPFTTVVRFGHRDYHDPRMERGCGAAKLPDVFRGDIALLTTTSDE